MRRLTILLIVLTIALTGLQAQTLDLGNGGGMYSIVPLPYGPRALPGPTSALWLNPAGIGFDGSSGMMFMNSFVTGDSATTGFKEDFGFGINLGALAYGVEVSRTNLEATRHTWASSSKIMDGLYLGSAYHWSSGLDRQNSYDFGFLARPTWWLSFGAQVTEVGRPRVNRNIVDPSYHFGLALKPMINWITFTADASIWSSDFARAELWDTTSVSYGDNLDLTFTANIQPHPNFALRGGYAMDREMIFAGLSIYSGAFSFSNYNARQRRGEGMTISLRTG
jgi:hypothetical protein